MEWGKDIFSATIVTGLIVGAAYAAERDPLAPRVPSDQIAAAKAWKNPYRPTPENIARGKELFTAKATCFVCHGNEGRGDGPVGATLVPPPTNFHNPKFDQVRTPGEMLWVIKNGSPGTGMISYTPSIINEDEAALIILYEKSLGSQP